MAAPHEHLVGRCLVRGDAVGEVLGSDVLLSSMGGVDPATGHVVDAHHPLRGTDLRGRVVAIPSGRGSCAGSLVILELLLAGTAPAALVFEHDETILPSESSSPTSCSGSASRWSSSVRPSSVSCAGRRDGCGSSTTPCGRTALGRSPRRGR